MSERRMPKCPASATKGFSSTPVKTNQDKDIQVLDDDLVSDDEDTFSLLSPIYHDSFDSDEEELQSSSRHGKDSRLYMSPVRSELPKTPSEQMFCPAVQPTASPSLSAWEMWLLNKTKEDRLKMEKKAEEERLVKEQKEHQKNQLEQKKLVMEEKIQGWLKVKRDQEKHEQLVKQRKEEEEKMKQQEKQREIEQKARQKYKDWLQKKNQEKNEKEKKQKEEAALKEELEKERRRRAEEMFKEWLVKANDKSRTSSGSSCYPASSSHKSYPAPGFYNPIPWKPIHVPPPETSQKKTPGKKQRQKKSQQSRCAGIRHRNSMSASHSLER